MSPLLQATIGMGLIAGGWSLGRWASSYDIKGWLTAAVWRAIWRRDTDLLFNPEPGAILDRDEVLRRQIADTANCIKADMQSRGTASALVKHGGLFGLAYVAGLVAIPAKLIGLIVLGHAIYRLLL